MQRHKLSITASSALCLLASGCTDDEAYTETSAEATDTGQEMETSGTSGTGTSGTGTSDTGTEESGDETGTMEIPDPVGPAGNNILVRVVSSETKEGIYNARINAGGESLHTDSGGYALINDLDADTLLLIKVAAQGYVPASRRVAIAEELAAYIEVEVVPEAEPQYFMASQGATIENGDISVKISPGTLVDQFNQPAEGMVEAIVTPVPVQSAPALLEGIDEQGVQTNLISFGMGNFTFRQGEDNELQLADGAYAEIEFPLPPETLLSQGDHVPLWWLNEETGEWEQEGQGTVEVENNTPRYKANANHFSTYNVDTALADQDAQCWVVVIREDGEPVSRAFSVEGQFQGDNVFVSEGWYDDSGVSHAVYDYNWSAGSQGNCVLAPVGAEAPLFIQGEPTEHVLTNGGPGGCWGNQYPDWLNPNCETVYIDINTAPECNTPNSPTICDDEQLGTYPYPLELGNGQCILGTKWCVNGSWSDCSDWVEPADYDDCSQVPLTDDDCSGDISYDACTCDDPWGPIPYSLTDPPRPCYEGPIHTVNRGNCRYGDSACTVQGWGSCNPPTPDQADPPLADPSYTPQIAPNQLITCEQESLLNGDENCDGFIGCSGAATWSGAVGSSQPASTVAGVDIAVHTGPGQGIYVAGSFNQQLSALPAGFLNLDNEAPSGNDGMLLKYSLDIDNPPEWAVIVQGSADDLIEGVTVDGNGNAYITGAYSGSLVIKDTNGVAPPSGPDAAGTYDVFVVQILADGTLGWVTTFNGPGYDSGLDIKVCPQDSSCDGQVVVSGTADADSGDVFPGVPAAGIDHGNDAFLVSLNLGDGSLVGGRMFGDVGTDYFSTVEVGAAAFLVGGRTVNTMDFSGALVDGGGVGAGFVAQLNETFGGLWATSFQGSFGGRANDVALNLVNGTEYVYVAGNYRGIGAAVTDGVNGVTPIPDTDGSQDIFVAQLLQASGAVVGLPLTVGSTGTDDATGVQVQNNDESIFLTGFFEGTATFTTPLNSQGGSDIFVMKYNSNSDWSINYGAAGDDVANAGFLVPGGNFYVTGSFINTISFGEDMHLNMDGGSDLFVLEQNP